VVVGQDWGDTDYFIKNHGVDAKDNPTNNMLRELLLSIGIDIGLPHERQDSSRVFLTNAILCLKTTGGMQGNVERKWFSNCGAAISDGTGTDTRPAYPHPLCFTALSAVRGASTESHKKRSVHSLYFFWAIISLKEWSWISGGVHLDARGDMK
jgi:hypothetical protein